jgi:hypothetical protein
VVSKKYICFITVHESIFYNLEITPGLNPI